MHVWITAPHFCAGMVTHRGWYAPILNYMRGWDLAKMTHYCAHKGWKLEARSKSGDWVTLT